MSEPSGYVNQNTFDKEAGPAAPADSTFRRITTMFRVIVQLPKLVLTIIENQGQIARAFQSQTAVLNQLNARLHWYERRVPLIAKEYLSFKHHEKKAIESAAAEANYAEREARRAAETAIVNDKSPPNQEITHTEGPPSPKLEIVSR